MFGQEVHSRFFGIVELPDGKAVTITDALLYFVVKWTLTYKTVICTR